MCRVYNLRGQLGKMKKKEKQRYRGKEGKV
jgi:hypothetical protein